MYILIYTNLSFKTIFPFLFLFTNAMFLIFLTLKVPYQYMLNSYIRYDFGGDGGTTEISNMVLDYYEHTQNEPDLQRYSIILLETITFYLAHYKETRVDPSTGRMVRSKI